MTTTLRPTGPLQHRADGGRSRHFLICVNSRPVGEIELATHEVYGPRVARLRGLRVDESDRGRGRATVAALAAEEVARGWGCDRIEASVQAAEAAALRLATALGYTERNRGMAKRLDTAAPAAPTGSVVRPMTAGEYGPWLAAGKDSYARGWIGRGVPETEARAKSERDHAGLLPDGLATSGTVVRVLDHDGTSVGTVWVALRDDDAFVFDVKVDAAHRGHGHGRTLMRHAEAEAIAAGRTVLGLNVFVDNTPALRLYESLGHEPVSHHLYKRLL